MEMKLALLIDAENIASKYVQGILEKANDLGNIIYKRIYGDWTSPQMSSWRTVLLDNSIQPIQQYNNTGYKNSSDFSLIIDAMDLLHLGKLDGFCIVSSDSDFTRLASRLRESEMYVLGMGEKKTPNSFISACNEFFYLDEDYLSRSRYNNRMVNMQSKKIKSISMAELSDINPSIGIIKEIIKQIADENADDEGWIYSGELGNLIKKKVPNFSVSNYQINGSKKFNKFIEGLGIFEIRKNNNCTTYYKLKYKLND